LSGLPNAAVALAKIVLIFAIGAVYSRAARGASSGVMLFTGLAWLVFSIAADLVEELDTVRGIYRLLGDPTVLPQNLRDLTILAWPVAPAAFARRGADDERWAVSGISR
jgi:hypothetical protein